MIGTRPSPGGRSIIRHTSVVILEEKNRRIDAIHRRHAHQYPSRKL
jgi:hypothetical protein